MVPFDPLVGEFRVHYAGFFDPGFGYAGAGGRGSRAVLEVRSREVPFILEHGQIVGRLVYEQMLARPDTLYGAGHRLELPGAGPEALQAFQSLAYGNALPRPPVTPMRLAMSRIILAMLFLAAAPSLATAQSTTATSGTTKPMTTAPASGNTQSVGQPKVVIPPAARSGEKGLRVGEGAADEPVEVKRKN